MHTHPTEKLSDEKMCGLLHLLSSERVRGTRNLFQKVLARGHPPPSAHLLLPTNLQTYKIKQEYQKGTFPSSVESARSTAPTLLILQNFQTLQKKDISLSKLVPGTAGRQSRFNPLEEAGGEQPPFLMGRKRRAFVRRK